jgi:hypothetical protein
MKAPAANAAVLFCTALCWTAAVSAAEPAPPGLWLGAESGTPLVYFKPAAGLTLVLSQVTHDGFGQPVGYTLELTPTASPKLTVQIRRASEAGASPAKFTARVGEHTLMELSAAKTQDELVALNPADAGGMVLAAVGELKEDVTTEFAYDDFGRRQVAAQTFALAGAKWKVTFSDYKRDDFGRLAGCQAVFIQLPTDAP